MISPGLFLIAVLSATGAAWILQEMAGRRRRKRLRHLALQWKMNFTRRDLFRLASRVSQNPLFPDARDMRVCDVMYGSSDQRRRFIFTLECVRGQGWQALGVRRVIAFSEPRDAPGSSNLSASAAPEHLPIIEQYAHLLSQG